MNLEIRKKEINDRLEEIRGLADSESDVSKLEELDKEADSLISERAALDKKMAETNLHDKQKDYQHLLFAGNAGNRILLFKDFFESKLHV